MKRLIGLLAVGWFLVRVIPKPTRAAYPCQQMAAGIGAGYIAWLAATLFAFRRAAGKAAAVSVVAVLALMVLRTSAIDPPAAPPDPPNQPIGTPAGSNPGRVAWVQDFAATKWDGREGHWWDDGNIDPAVAARMLANALRGLTGAKNDKAAWDRLFRFHHPSNGYQKGESIVIKLNCNADSGKPWSNNGYPSPPVVEALVRSLIDAGVPGDAILLSDASRVIGDNIYRRVSKYGVRIEDSAGGAASGRVKAEPDMDSPIYFPMPGGAKATYYLPLSYRQAAYMINYALFRPHRVFGVTGAAKNHFGSVYDPELKTFKPTKLHAFALWDYATPNHKGDPHSHPNLLGHKLTGGKTVLYLLDGLYTSRDQGAPVVRWQSIGDRWFSSVLASQDPVALDSVAYDFILSEPNLVKGNPSFNGHADSFLHEAALAAKPASGATYDPEGDGIALPSLGVHEHWNNAAEKRYTRIHLVSIP